MGLFEKSSGMAESGTNEVNVNESKVCDIFIFVSFIVGFVVIFGFDIWVF